MDQTLQAIYFLYLKYDMLTCLASLANQVGSVIDENADLSKLGDHAISMAVVEVIQNKAIRSHAVGDLYELRKGLKDFIKDYGN